MTMSGTAANHATARLVVTHGPDRGMWFNIGEELSHVGRGRENSVILSDPAVAEHQLSIVYRNGRYALYTPLEKSVEIDGSMIPHARWVWLPESAKIRLSDKTTLQFTVGADGGTTSSERPGAEQSNGSPTAAPRKGDGAAGKKSKKKEQTVARFITDKPGEALVTLGEDGNLPELNLVEGAERAASRQEKKESNPLVIYGLVAMSLIVSVVLVLVDSEGGGSSTSDKTRARAEIREFYGADEGNLLPWQRTLREARLAASRGDRGAERRAYRRVLDQLNSEDISRFTGLTGSPEQDDKLRRLIGTLLVD